MRVLLNLNLHFFEFKLHLQQNPLCFKEVAFYYWVGPLGGPLSQSSYVKRFECHYCCLLDFWLHIYIYIYKYIKALYILETSSASEIKA